MTAYVEIQSNRTNHKYSHGALVHGVEKYFEKKRGYRSYGPEQRPEKPNDKNLSEGRVHDLLMTKSGNYIGIEVLNHIYPDLYEATSLVNKFKETKIKKLITVSAQQPTAGFLEHCGENKVEVFVISKISKLGYLTLKKLI